ncbi:MAG: ribonuclease P protein component [Clostridia bacterium]|nr:ribonuclease P protein component [Clostridia bacterium]
MLKEDVLRKREDFNNLRKYGKSFGSAYVVLVVNNKKGQALNRKAFLASKKVGNSVVRHRAVRLMKESFRQIEKEKALKQGYDLLFIARPTIKDLKCADVKKSIEAAIRRAALYQ